MKSRIQCTRTYLLGTIYMAFCRGGMVGDGWVWNEVGLYGVFRISGFERDFCVELDGATVGSKEDVTFGRATLERTGSTRCCVS